MLRLFRVDEHHEIEGLDTVKHNEPAYPIGNNVWISTGPPVTLALLDSYIEEDERPKSVITASLYGEMTRGMMNQPGAQWANRAQHGQMPPVSFLKVENWFKDLLFIRDISTSTLLRYKCPTITRTNHPPHATSPPAHQAITQVVWVASKCTIPTWWPYQKEGNQTLHLPHHHNRNLGALQSTTIKSNRDYSSHVDKIRIYQIYYLYISVHTNFS